MSVRLLPLSCERCSAPLRVPEGVGRVTCASCGTPLAVERSGGVAFTRELEELRAETAQIAGDVRRLKVESELATLDREWREYLETFGTTKSGSPDVPTRGMAVALIVIGAGGSFVGLSQGGEKATTVLLLSPLLIVFGVLQWPQVAEHERRERDYEAKRNDLLSRLNHDA